MAKKLTDLTVEAISLESADLLHLVDVSDTTSDPAGTSKKLTLGVLKDFIGSVGSIAWGDITGTLSDQTDLQDALALKYDASDYNSDWDSRLATKDTDDLTEGSNLYYTQARFDTAFGLKDTDGLTEGATNFYYTEGRFDTSLATKDTGDLTEGTNLYYTQARFDSAFALKDTDDLTDTATNRYTNDTDITRLANTSGTNTGDQDLTPYALKSNVLELDNTDVYSPTTQYHPATKLYVDTAINSTVRLQGDWNADTNTPDITSETTTGFAWRVSVAGSTDLGGIDDWAVGDLAVKTDSGWIKIANQDVSAVWGNIVGTVSDQTDLISYVTGLPISTFTNDAGYLTAETDTLQSVTNRGSITTNDIEALSFTKTGGVSTEFLKADGSVDTNTYLTADVSIADGGTGQSTAQTAINALTSVAGATNEYVLTKDTGTGNAIWKVASGGGGGASTLAEVSTGSDDTAKSLYTMTSAVDVEFESSDNNTILYLDEANERVGIGTTSPAYKLDIAGKIAISGEQTIYNAEGEDGFTGSLFIGDGGGSLLHTTGAEGYYNTGVGIGALIANTTGSHNTANGYYSLNSNTTGLYNTALGTSSLYSNTTGDNNIAIGRSSLYFNTTGSFNTASGMYSLYSNDSGSYNTANGYYSLGSNRTGRYNTASGRYSLRLNTTGFFNTASGNYSLGSNTTGDNNIAIGYQSGRYITDGVTGNTTGDSNIFIGRDTKAFANNDQNEIVIGYNATGAGSNSVVLGNDSIVTTLLKGDVGIGTITPAQKLDVAGNAKFSAVGSGAYAFDLNLTSDGTLTTSSSDERLKENVLTLDSDDILEKINQLNPSSFEWKSNNSPDIGLIAQEVESVFPGLVFTNPTDGYKGINYSRLSTLAISAIQEVDKRLEVIRGYITETGEGLVAIFKELTVGKLNIDGDVCVDDVCITKEQFKNLLLSTEPEQVNQTQTNTSSESTTTSGTTDSETANEAVTEFSDDNISEDTGISESENLVPVEDSEADVVEIILNEEEVVETTDTQEVIDDTIMDSEPIVEDTETPAPQEELNNV